MINYIVGDATNPIGSGLKYLIHIVNNRKKWGKGFVLAVSRKWKQPEEEFRKANLKLGNV